MTANGVYSPLPAHRCQGILSRDPDRTRRVGAVIASEAKQSPVLLPPYAVGQSVALKTQEKSAQGKAHNARRRPGSAFSHHHSPIGARDGAPREIQAGRCDSSRCVRMGVCAFSRTFSASVRGPGTRGGGPSLHSALAPGWFLAAPSALRTLRALGALPDATRTPRLRVKDAE